MKKIIFILAIVTMGAQAAYAVIPDTISFQGRLTDAAGIPVTDGTYSVQINVYKTITDTAQAWGELHNPSTQNGYFTVELGSITPFSGVLDFSEPYYVGIKVGADSEMTPRQLLQSVPYAMRAKYAAEALSVSDDSVDSSKIVDGSIGNDDITDNTISGGKLQSRSLDGGKIALGSVGWGEIADGAINTQAKAPWAPTWNGGINNPKIASGFGTTDASGDLTVDISTYSFSSVPVIIVTPIRGDASCIVSIVEGATASSFSVRTRSVTAASYGACIFSWMAIGN